VKRLNSFTSHTSDSCQAGLDDIRHIQQLPADGNFSFQLFHRQSVEQILFIPSVQLTQRLPGAREQEVIGMDK
jgi:hypothetical protein